MLALCNAVEPVQAAHNLLENSRRKAFCKKPSPYYNIGVPRLNVDEAYKILGGFGEAN